MREELVSFKLQEQQQSATASKVSGQPSSTTTDKLSQADFCEYLGEDSSNVSAKARRKSLLTEDYLKAVAYELKGEAWEREPGLKGKWVRKSD